MRNKLILDISELTIAKNFYSKCLSLGFVKVQRDNEQDITVLRLTDTRFEHYIDNLPFKVGSICYVSPKVSVKVLNMLLTVDKIGTVYEVALIKNKYLRVKVINNKNKKRTLKCKLWTLNYK